MRNIINNLRCIESIRILRFEQKAKDLESKQTIIVEFNNISCVISAIELEASNSLIDVLHFEVQGERILNTKLFAQSESISFQSTWSVNHIMLSIFINDRFENQIVMYHLKHFEDI